MAKTLLEQLRGGSSLLNQMRGIEDTPGNRELMQSLQEPIPAPEHKPHVPGNALEAGLVAAGGRFHEIDMGVRGMFGDVEEERAQHKSLMSPVEEAYPVANTVGSLATDVAVSFLPGLGAMSLVSKVPKLASAAPWIQRLVAGLSGGAAEGAVIGLAEENPKTGIAVGGTLGAVAEIALPPGMRKVAKLARIFLGKALKPAALASAKEFTEDEIAKVMPDLKEALEKFNLTIDDITDAVLTNLPENMTPDQAARAILFEKNKVPTTRARITQNADDFANEVRILRQIDDTAADMVRQRISDESAAIQTRATALAEKIGQGEQAGETIKIALQRLDTDQRQGIKEAYDALLELTDASNAGGIPLNGSMIRGAIDDVLFGTRPLTDETRGAIQRAAAKYGIIGEGPVKKGAQTVVDWDGAKITFNGDVEPLNMQNFEAFRQQLNQAFQKDTTGAVKAVKSALDDTVLEATDVLREVGDDRQFIQELAEKARQTVIGRRELLDTGKLVPKLLNENPRTGSPFTEASQVASNIFARGTPSEEVVRLVTALNASGEAGKEAIKNLQASTVMRLVDKAFKNAGKLKDGQTPFNVTAYSNELRSIGPDKLKAIFDGDEGTLQAINELERIGHLMRTPDSAVQKGSGPDMINAFIRSARLTAGMGGEVLMLAASQLAGAQYKAMSNRAIRKRIIEMAGLNEEAGITFIEQTFPELATVLGFTTAGTTGAIE